MTTKESWIKRKERYGKSGCKNPEEKKRKISERSKNFWKNLEYIKKVMDARKKTRDKLGYINSPETRKKLSKAMKKRFEEGKFNPKDISPFIKGHKIGMYGKYHSKKTKEKMSKSNKGFTEYARMKSKEKRKYQVIPIKDTLIELKIQNFLTLLHIEYFTHKYISEITHSYQCDILIPTQNGINQKIIIECDGCFFHVCPICKLKEYSWTKDRRKLDKLRTKELQEKGFKVLRLWEHEIKVMELNDFKGILYKR